MIIKESVDSTTVLSLGDQSATLASGEMSITTNSQYGNFILGPLSITSPFTNIRFNSGMFKFNSLLLSTMPSTLASPVPVFEIDLPTDNIASVTSLTTMILATLGT